MTAYLNYYTGVQAVVPFMKNLMVKNEVKIDCATNVRLVADTDRCLPIPAYAHVLKVSGYAVTGEASVTVSLGDSVAADGWDSAGDVGTTGNKIGPVAGTDANIGGYYYSAADYVLLTWGGATANSLILLVAIEYSVMETALA